MSLKAYKVYDTQTQKYWENNYNAFGVWATSAAAKADVTYSLMELYCDDKEEMKRVNKKFKDQTRYQIHEFNIELKRIVK